MDLGSHTVCAVVTEDFLRYSKSRGNDLMTPRPEFSFPGLKVSKEGEREGVCSILYILTSLSFHANTSIMPMCFLLPSVFFALPHLQTGDKWCLCASRWAEAYDEGVACSVVLKATHVKALDVCELSALIEHAIDPPASHTKDAAAGGGGKEGVEGGGKEHGEKAPPPRRHEEL